MSQSTIQISDSFKDEVLAVIKEYGEEDTNIQAIQYEFVNQNGEHSVEILNYIYLSDDELVGGYAIDFNESLTDALHDLINFSDKSSEYLKVLERGIEFVLVDLDEFRMNLGSLKQMLQFYKKQSEKVLSRQQVEHFKYWVYEELKEELLAAAKANKPYKQYKMEDFYFNGINTHDLMIHHLKDFCKLEGLRCVVSGTNLEISWNK